MITIPVTYIDLKNVDLVPARDLECDEHIFSFRTYNIPHTRFVNTEVVVHLYTDTNRIIIEKDNCDICFVFDIMQEDRNHLIQKYMM